MKLGELYQFVTDLVENKGIDLDTPVIYSGEYGYGDDLRSVSLSRKYLIDEEVLERNKQVVEFFVEAYVYESEDVGNCRMWCDDEDANWLEEQSEED